MNWKKELVSSFRSPDDLPQEFALSDVERSCFGKVRQKGLPFLVTAYYLSLTGTNRNDPIRIQSIPGIEELIEKPTEVTDPLDEEKYKVTGRLIHRYPDRVLFLTTDTCAMYCRHCFRRNFTGHKNGPAGMKEVKEASAYIAAHKEVREVIFSGGDPLMLETSLLEKYLYSFKNARQDIIFRIGTRIPVVLPSRIDNTLVSILSEFKPLFIMTQFNHPREITETSMGGTSLFIDAGIPVLNQAVLLRKVNDSVETLEALFTRLLFNRIKPYYLFQGDMAAGTSHLRVPLKKGLSLMKELRKRISGMAMPVYAVDLPGGGGKVPLTESYINGLTDKGWELKDAGGKTYLYPDEEE